MKGAAIVFVRNLGLALVCMCLTVAIAMTQEAAAAQVNTSIVDVFGRPVEGARLKVTWAKSGPRDTVESVPVATFLSDHRGVVKGEFRAPKQARPNDIWFTVENEGYASYSDSRGLIPKYVISRKFSLADVEVASKLGSEDLLRELREMLAGTFDHEQPSYFEVIFGREHLFRPALLKLVRDPVVGREAGVLLSYIGVSADIQFFLKHAPPASSNGFDNRWAYSIVTALIDPETELEWDFLRRCAINLEYDDRWVDAGAISTLRLNASARSKKLLQEVAELNPERKNMVVESLKYIDSRPLPIANSDLQNAAREMANAIRVGKWQKNGQPRFNQLRDKALVDAHFRSGRDLLIYTGTFHLQDGKWRLRGVRETLQVLLAE